MQSENDPRFDSFLEKIKMNAKADIYCVDIDENSSEEQIQKEKEKLYATGGFFSFPLKTDYINDRERIYTDKLRCQKMDSHDNSWLYILIFTSLIMGFEFYMFISVLISFIIWR